MRTFYRPLLSLCFALLLGVTLVACGDADEGTLEEERFETMDTDTVEIETDTMVAPPDTAMMPGDTTMMESDTTM